MQIGDLVRADTQVFLFGLSSSRSESGQSARMIASAETGEIVLILSLLPNGWSICTFPSGQTGFARLSNC